MPEEYQINVTRMSQTVGEMVESFEDSVRLSDLYAGLINESRELWHFAREANKRYLLQTGIILHTALSNTKSENVTLDQLLVVQGVLTEIQERDPDLEMVREIHRKLRSVDFDTLGSDLREGLREISYLREN